MLQYTSETDWNKLVTDYDGHPLQLWGWGEVKAAHNWSVDRVQIGKGGAQLLIKRLPKPFGPLVYIARGPFGELLTNQADRQELIRYVRQKYKPTLISVEPDTLGKLSWKGWRKSPNHILIARTAVLDLTQSEDEMLAQMSKKTRQYIRKSAGEGTRVAQAKTLKDIDDCLAIYKQTAQRAGFELHGDDYYYDIFMKLKSNSPVFMARQNGKTIAFLWPVVTDSIAFELYGGMNDEGQRLRANYHLKWSVVREMKRRGLKTYDVNGLLNDGVSAFKKGFIPEETILSGTYDLPLSPLYWIWSIGLPTAKKIARKLGS